ncbi:MAG: 4Fe-4S dicluster domain-containing protein [Erysipelotrichaceae bacterium]|nr:4Fe-4S dicluster domain-containing protein [Erysipelotrichaceae bacterium]
MRKSVVHYTLERCIRCMKCVKACPTSALSMSDDRVIIDQKRCINCGRCIMACHNRGILAQGSTLDDIENYDYTICLVPGALISHCASLEEAEDLFHAIRLLGFDEVVDITQYTALHLKEVSLLAEENEGDPYIASFCPVIARLIQNSHKSLLDALLPVKNCSEIAAMDLRKKYAHIKNLGIFNLCECESKLELAKYPYGNPQYEVDHALALTDIFPLIRKNMHKGKDPVSFCKEGLQVCNPHRIVRQDGFLIADGFDKVCTVLDMAEFGLLNEFRLLILYPCFNGCIGGHMLWGNSFLATNNIDALTAKNTKPAADLPFEELYTDEFAKDDDDKRSFMERTRFFKAVNEEFERLPGYDCSACGMQTCRIMAEEIVKGNRTEDDCRVMKTLKETAQ